MRKFCCRKNIVEIAHFCINIFRSKKNTWIQNLKTVSCTVSCIIPEDFKIILLFSYSKLNRILSKRKDKIESLRIEELNWTERKQITSHLLKKFGKTLTDSAFDNQLATIASKREANNPAFLKLLCTEISKFGVFEKVDEELKVLGEF